MIKSFTSCKWVANKKHDSLTDKRLIAEATIDIPETVSVPEHNSSPMTNDLSSILSSICRSSFISNTKVDCFLKRSSLPVILVKILSKGHRVNSVAGTHIPDCANIVAMAIDFMKQLLPDALTPYSNTPCLSNSMSFGTYFTSSHTFSTIKCRNPLARMLPLPNSLLNTFGLCNLYLLLFSTHVRLKS